jgi:hypothetical protein
MNQNFVTAFVDWYIFSIVDLAVLKSTIEKIYTSLQYCHEIVVHLAELKSKIEKNTPFYKYCHFSNISAISWRSVLLMEETGENHRPVASH